MKVLPSYLSALCLLFVMTSSYVVSFFDVPTLRHRRHTLKSSHQLSWSSQKNPCEDSGSFRPQDILKKFSLATTIAAAIMSISLSDVQPALATEEKFVSALSSIVNAKKILAPVKNYVELQGYDNARTNIYYIVNNLGLQKKADALIQNSIDVVDDEAKIERAQEAASRIANTASQLDSSVYTVIFIPSEDGTINPTQEKYRKQAYKFYDDFNADLDDLIQVADEATLKKAEVQAEKELSTMPKVLFTDKVKQSGISGSGGGVN